MCEKCLYITTYAQLDKVDPTRTSVLRGTFVREMKKRFSTIKKLIYKAVVEEDCFGLNNSFQANVMVIPKFQFTTTYEKVGAFMEWLQRQVDLELLTVEYRMQSGGAIQTPWTNVYISDSYKRGVLRANYEAKRSKASNVISIEQRGGIDAVLQSSIHADRLGVLYTRTFMELKGITKDMDTQVSKVLTQGLADGDSPKVIARNLVKTIGGGLELEVKNKAGITLRTLSPEQRAIMLARTEVIRAHHVGMIQEYKNYELAGVYVKAEWSTAGDDKVCEECASLDGKIFTIEEAEPLIPVHPNCRCIVLPIVMEEGNV